MAESKPIKVFDVSKPGKSAPSASSKPILITNRPVLKDPMMKEETDTPEESEKSKPIMVNGRMKIEPLHIETDMQTEKVEVATKRVAQKPTEPAPKPASSKKAEARSADIRPAKTTAAEHDDTDDKPSKPEPGPAADEPAKPQPETASEKEPADEPADDTAPAEEATDSDDEQSDDTRDELKDIKPGGSENAEEVAAQKEQERDDELQKLALSHKYYLPINQVERRRNKRNTWLGVVLVVLLCVAWADVSLDAGLISIPGVKAPTHFFTK